MSQQNFITQSSLVAKTPKASHNSDGRLIMADFSVFHAVSDNREHFVDPETASQENQDYLNGVEAGKAEARAVYESTIQVMEKTLETLKSSFAKQVSEIEASHGRVIAKCLEAVLPDTANKILLSEMNKVLEQAANAEIQGQIIVKLHPHNIIAKDFLKGKGGVDFKVIETENMPEDAASFMWEKSRVDIDPMTAAKTCLDLISRQFGEVLSITQSPQSINKEA
ncbi:hypothetical protein DES40_1506 [Litorimonas taeanensis]|uniref:Flagellar assembly protein FliH n=1 Tax=Litorimonas taeanensis TaxID=568099 RepID=A0A420WMF8_9PROT|nr:hypothetical protein [Litorimonas taeanensis]RKQ72169.1 hypothetical protein DES40_1506 [Litorimonas taeanensis]